MAAESPELERRGVPSANAVTSGTRAIAGGKPRVVGVDVARGLALIGMMATHVFATLDDNDNPTVATVVASGRAAATFVLVAGVSLAFLSGRRTAVRGRDRGVGRARRPRGTGRRAWPRPRVSRAFQRGRRDSALLWSAVSARDPAVGLRTARTDRDRRGGDRPWPAAHRGDSRRRAAPLRLRPRPDVQHAGPRPGRAARPVVPHRHLPGDRLPGLPSSAWGW
ncbi:heparan-alpha-glucosaminide N-acetyltransferase domain-containing protein [Pseudonocardia aurantiaca]|uniref:Heparan-alpha-glucosaminide N-acetyltransferase domain-containing protein n=1 Tax=Pseudonocardia aurantiaca TaxID=75290 RepID=A0ABW4FNG0_9PSEU